MKSKIIKILTLFSMIMILVGCDKTDEDTKFDKSKYKTDNYDYITCTRNAETSDDSTVDINLKVYYNKDKYIEILHSKEKITSNSSDVLDQYEDAYKNIYSAYDGLEYYDNVVTRESDSVISETYINYGKIDIDKLMEIEGEEDNVTITDGKIKLSDWEAFAKKYGTTCS